MGDVLTADHIQKAMRMIEDRCIYGRALAYYATPNEMANAAWVSRFKANFPDVELVEVKPILR